MNNHIPLATNSSHDNTKAVFVPSYDGRQVLHQISIRGNDHTHDLIHDSTVLELVAAR